MNILVVCQHYFPEPFRISDICEGLVKKGHSVTVVTGTPNYPMGEIYAGYENGKKKDEIINGVKVHRVFEIPRKKGILFRFLNYYSFSISSRLYVNKINDFDAVFINQLSPVMMASAGIKYAKKHKVKSLLYCLDLWPESLTVGGVKPDSFIYKHYLKVSSKIYLSSDKIAVSSSSFEDYFRTKFGIQNCEFLPQYCEDIFDADKCQKTPNEYTDIMFAGNVGTAQSIDTVIKAAKITSDDEKIKWHIVGEGTELEKVKADAEGLNNVIFYGRHDVSEMPSFYSKADFMLVTMRKGGLESKTLPGKVQSYFAAGKPVLCAADGEANKTVLAAGCGLCSPSEDPQSLADNARRLKNCNAREMGRKAKEYSEKHYNKDAFLTRIEELLK